MGRSIRSGRSSARRLVGRRRRRRARWTCALAAPQVSPGSCSAGSRSANDGRCEVVEVVGELALGRTGRAPTGGHPGLLEHLGRVPHRVPHQRQRAGALGVDVGQQQCPHLRPDLVAASAPARAAAGAPPARRTPRKADEDPLDAALRPTRAAPPRPRRPAPPRSAPAPPRRPGRRVRSERPDRHRRAGLASSAIATHAGRCEPARTHRARARARSPCGTTPARRGRARPPATSSSSSAAWCRRHHGGRAGARDQPAAGLLPAPRRRRPSATWCRPAPARWCEWKGEASYFDRRGRRPAGRRRGLDLPRPDARLRGDPRATSRSTPS